MRARVLLAVLLLAALAAVLAAATCRGERSAGPAQSDEPSAATDAGPSADSPTGAAPTRAPDADPTAARRPPRTRAARPVPREPVAVVLEETSFHEPAASWETEKRIDVTATPTGVLVAKWIAMSDSGVELERRSEGKVLWRAHVAPLGVAHSKYHQDVTVRVDGDRVVVESVGARKILEVRDLETGAQASREVTDVAR